MEPRNNFTPLERAGIPITQESYVCSYWGRHHPPRIEDGRIVIEVGRGYRSNKHLHGQNLYVVEVEPAQCIALIEMRKYGDLYGSGLWHYLIGIDGAPFIAQIPSTIDSLAEALDYLMPVEVQRAIEAGVEVLRQGDWYFVPVNRMPRGEVQAAYALDGQDHVADEAVPLRTVTYVRGTVRHGEHAALDLGETWHKAVRNRAIRTGILTGGRRGRGSRYVD